MTAGYPSPHGQASGGDRRRPPRVGGAVRLAERGHEVTVLSTDLGGLTGLSLEVVGDQRAPAVAKTRSV